jgi:hypothetical protein
MRARPHVLILFFSLFLFSGCSESSQPSEPQIGLDIHGRYVVYPPNQQFSLELDLHADGGYQWYYDISDTTVVRIDSTMFRSKRGQNVPGGLTVETFYFRTIMNGRCTLCLKECRLWEKDIPPINTELFWVVVR